MPSPLPMLPTLASFRCGRGRHVAAAAQPHVLLRPWPRPGLRVPRRLESWGSSDRETLICGPTTREPCRYWIVYTSLPEMCPRGHHTPAFFESVRQPPPQSSWVSFTSLERLEPGFPYQRPDWPHNTSRTPSITLPPPRLSSHCRGLIFSRDATRDFLLSPTRYTGCCGLPAAARVLPGAVDEEAAERGSIAAPLLAPSVSWSGVAVLLCAAAAAAEGDFPKVVVVSDSLGGCSSVTGPRPAAAGSNGCVGGISSVAGSSIALSSRAAVSGFAVSDFRGRPLFFLGFSVGGSGSGTTGLVAATLSDASLLASSSWAGAS